MLKKGIFWFSSRKQHQQNSDFKLHFRSLRKIAILARQYFFFIRELPWLYPWTREEVPKGISQLEGNLNLFDSGQTSERTRFYDVCCHLVPLFLFPTLGKMAVIVHKKLQGIKWVSVHYSSAATAEKHELMMISIIQGLLDVELGWKVVWSGNSKALLTSLGLFQHSNKKYNFMYTGKGY